MPAQRSANAVLSYEVRSLKPEPAIYDEAIRRAGVAADRIFFVDDRVENVEGARRAGMDAVVFTGVDQLQRELARRGERSGV